MILPTESRPTLSADHHRWLYLPTDVIVRTIWQERYKVLMITVMFAGIGTVIALLIKPEFRSEARIMPEMTNGSGDILKRLASVAGFAGVDFSEAEGMDAIRPDLYPNVLQSTPFILYLINQSVSTTDGQFQTIAQLLLPDNSHWFWNPLGLGKSNKSLPLTKGKVAGTVRLSVSQQELSEEINERISAKFDTRSGIITISAKMPDANVAAAVAQFAMNYLTKYVTEYRTGKSRQDLQFYEQQLVQAYKRYTKAQFNVFQYSDQHKNIVRLATTMDRHRMETELTIAQNVYTELSSQFEQLKIKVQNRTPIFSVLEPPKVPLKRTSPKRVVIVLLSTVSGLLLGIGYVLIRKANLAGQLRAMLGPV